MIYQGVRQPKGFPSLPAGWVSEWETFPSSDGALQLFAVTHHKEPWNGHRALVVLHGLGEHGGRYLHVPHYVQKEVDAVYCLDHRGHGRSEGLRGHVDRFDLLGEDAAHAIRRFEQSLRKKHGRAEVHLLAHSLGAHIALRALFANPDLPLHSVTLSAPFLGIKAHVPIPKKVGAVALSYVWGSLQLSTGLNASSISHDPEVVEAYRMDRLNHEKMTPRFFTTMNRAFADTLGRDSGVEIPIQFLIPLQDGLVDADKALGFARGFKSRDKRIKTYASFFHEPLNEIGKEEVFSDLASWIGMHRSSNA